MTHTRSAWTHEDDEGGIQEGLVDVRVGAGLEDHGGSIAHGWERAMQLANQGGELGGRFGPDNNSDTLAQFGNGKYVAHEMVKVADFSSLQVAGRSDVSKKGRAVGEDSAEGFAQRPA
jgi:hypothetical protein